MAVDPTDGFTRSEQQRRRSRLSRVGLGAAAGLVALGMLAACSSSGKSTSTTAAGSASKSVSVSATTSMTSGSAGTSSSGTPQSAAMIHISSFKYMVPASVSPGAMVSVMNMDGENHTVTADSGNAFDVKANAGAIVMFAAPKTPGSYPFHCTYHSNMHGVLVVK
jgi:plastocyanin